MQSTPDNIEDMLAGGMDIDELPDDPYALSEEDFLAGGRGRGKLLREQEEREEAEAAQQSEE